MTSLKYGLVITGSGGGIGMAHSQSDTAYATLNNSTLTLGYAGTIGGGLLLAGSSSGTVSILPQPAAGTYNFNLPITAGNNNDLFVGKGGGSNPIIWQSLTNYLDVVIGSTQGSIITRNASAWQILTPGTATFVLSSQGPGQNLIWESAGGGTGIGTFGTSLSNASPYITGDLTTGFYTPGSAQVALSVSGVNLITWTSAGQIFSGSSSGAITVAAQAAAGTYNFNLPITAGSSGQVLTSAAGGSSPMTWTTLVPTVLGNVTGGTVLGNPTSGNTTLSSTSAPVLGIAASTAGTLGLANGGGSGQIVTIKNLGAIAAYNFNLPTTAGSTGQVLASAGGLAASMTWTSLAASATTDTTNANNITTGTLSLSLLGTPAGGTVLGNATGGAASVSATAAPVLGIAASVSGTLGLANGGATGNIVTIKNLGATAAYNFNLPTTAGTSGQALISGGGISTSMTWTSVPTIASGKTFTVNNSLTLAGTDSTTFTFPGTTDTVVTLTATQTLTNKTLTTAVLGSSTATTQSAGDNSTKVATTAFVNAAVNPAPTILASGSGTYNTPAGAIYLRIRMCGGGGGGAGSADVTENGGPGGTGGNTTFGSALLVANGGQGGNSSASGQLGAGGTASLGGATGIALTGGTGCGGQQMNTAGSYAYGGSGGVNAFGGSAGAPASTGSGLGGITNTGAGGSGAAGTNVGQSNGGGGGGAGGFVEAWISSPSATYSYAVGGAGTQGGAGTNGNPGGPGGSGVIIIEAF